MPLFRVIVFDEADTAAADARSVAHDTLHHLFVLVGIVQVLLQIVDVVLDSHKYIREHTPRVLQGDEGTIEVVLGIDITRNPVCKIEHEE